MADWRMKKYSSQYGAVAEMLFGGSAIKAQKGKTAYRTPSRRLAEPRPHNPQLKKGTRHTESKLWPTKK